MIVVVGAGVVGLASAYALARRGLPVCVLERHARPGLETSTHNSGVVHAGLYHPQQSLKTRLCHDGRERLYSFCQRHRVPHVKCGKLIVAGPGEEGDLIDLEKGAAANGVRLEPLTATEVRRREPRIHAAAALWSGETGWVEAEAFVRALLDEVVRLEGIVLFGTPIAGVEHAPGDSLVVVTPRERIEAETVINAAGLFADDVSALAGGDRFTIYPCRGEYAELAQKARGLINGLVYPVPHASGHGLGVHLTRTLQGAVWIGPTIRYQEGKNDYEQNRLPLQDFLEPTRQLLPEVTLDDLRLAGSGIRAKLHPPTERFADFLIGRDTRVPALVHAAGIDSPGLTASLAIGEYVAGLILRA
ncbi:MAG TPA: FAD-dependent oxidoreductase [Vicinamibacterales bacterium]|nr:FAD-dependent oxidoreductase [Vicinamibacterales bacterium]